MLKKYMRFATIQFIDNHSESIRNKNFLKVDGKPLWEYNAELALNFSAFWDNLPPICGKYICTNYSDEELGETGKRFTIIPRQFIDTGKCSLSSRVHSAISYIRGYDDCDYTGYILLLGNSRLFRPTLANRMITLFSELSKCTEITAMIPVTKMSPFNPYRSYEREHGAFLKSVLPLGGKCKIGVTNGEDRRDCERYSYFYNGGPMIVADESLVLPLMDNPNDWGDSATHLPYLGKSVYGFEMDPLDCIELDEPWQIGMMSNDYRLLNDKIVEENGMIP